MTATSCISALPLKEPLRHQIHDVAIVGAGVAGLWVARHLAEAGLAVALLDRGPVAGGASGGLLGALLPHMPSGWNAKKQFQYEALCALPALVARLEEETGIDPLYRRCGRISPIRRPGFLRQTQAHIARHREVWPDNCGGRAFYRLARPDEFAGWITPQSAPLGLAHESLSACLDPRAYGAALRASLAHLGVDVLENSRVATCDAARGEVVLAGGGTLRAGAFVITAGVDSFALLAPWLGCEIGAGVGGQVALFAVKDLPDEAPIIYDDGVYIVPRPDDPAGPRIAVGSGRDAQDLERVVARAKALCPVLEKARLIEVWSGMRPRCHAKDPLVGQLPGRRIFVATGGFKITMGIAHHMARALTERILGHSEPLALPESYTMAWHLDKLKERQAVARSEVL